MDAFAAEDIARRIHAGQRGRGGRPLVEHLERVAAAVPPPARATAWLHDALETTAVAGEELRAAGLDADELDALALLARMPMSPTSSTRCASPTPSTRPGAWPARSSSPRSTTISRTTPTRRPRRPMRGRGVASRSPTRGRRRRAR